MNRYDDLLQNLHTLQLSRDEAKMYLALLREPSTHLHLSHVTGINRTKVYRLASELEKRSLITRRTDDRGTFLVATDPATLEVELITREAVIKKQRAAFAHVMPTLEELKNDALRGFTLHTYEGVEGFKQMLWHELKTKGECLCFGNGELERLVPDHEWTEKQRAMQIEAGYSIRELLNPDTKRPDFTDLPTFKDRYQPRIIPESVLRMTQQTLIYNDTVAIYNWQDDHKVGMEIVSPNYATMMRQTFERFWELARAPESSGLK